MWPPKWTALIAVLAALILFGTPIRTGAAGPEDAPQQERSGSRPWIMVALAPYGHGGGKAFSVIKQLSGNPRGIIVHFTEFTLELVAEKQPEFIVLSPQGTPWCRYTGERGVALQSFLWILPIIAEEMNIPILGICGGHQALALAFGGKVGPIRGGESDCFPYSRERQSGIVPLKMEMTDPIFRGIDGSLRIVESHYDEVKVLPPGFVLLASDRKSPNQIIRHATKPVYGIQGHPEHFSGDRPDGGLLIKNFLKIVLGQQRPLGRVFPTDSAVPAAPPKPEESTSSN
jgi:GMP synthase-like glutamine amidotransferase